MDIPFGIWAIAFDCPFLVIQDTMKPKIDVHVIPFFKERSPLFHIIRWYICDPVFSNEEAFDVTVSVGSILGHNSASRVSVISYNHALPGVKGFFFFR